MPNWGRIPCSILIDLSPIAAPLVPQTVHQNHLRGRQAGGIRPDRPAQIARRTGPRRYQGDLPLAGLEHPQRGLGAAHDGDAARSSHVGSHRCVWRAEDNIFWRRIAEAGENQLAAAGARSIAVRDAQPLGDDIIHSVNQSDLQIHRRDPCLRRGFLRCPPQRMGSGHAVRAPLRRQPRPPDFRRSQSALRCRSWLTSEAHDHRSQA